jgi:hypothetical protein
LPDIHIGEFGPMCGGGFGVGQGISGHRIRPPWRCWWSPGAGVESRWLGAE